MVGSAYHCSRFVISGKVQGVGFRAATVDEARAIGLAGWVRNLSDGSVEAVAGHADEARLAQFSVWLHHGPVFAQVAAVTSEPHNSSIPLPDPFEIRR